MLQQTRVDTVIPYYERFLNYLPTVHDLAHASDDLLLKLWEGLGYYSRVRNMKEAAQQILERHGGQFPSRHEDIARLKGIGPYTAGAISSIAFGLPEPAVDGNVMRVVSRLFEVDYDIGIPSNRKIFQSIMEVLIDPHYPGDFNQAMMDLGSDIESPVNPRPEESPVKDFSAAYQHGTMDRYPIKAPKKRPIPQRLQALIIRNEQGEFLLEKNEEKGLLSGFWHFPLFELQGHSDDSKEAGESAIVFSEQRDVKKWFASTYGLEIDWEENVYPKVQHIFSHRKWTIEILSGLSKKECPNSPHLKWVSVSDFHEYPFAKPQHKMWDAFRQGERIE
ncbi:A/G-specific adenine glycosylase [Streptococcus sp. DD13]|nr:A/G-specific adenine glycosylase [Streptococcus sp. DD13]